MTHIAFIFIRGLVNDMRTLHFATRQTDRWTSMLQYNALQNIQQTFWKDQKWHTLQIRQFWKFCNL